MTRSEAERLLEDRNERICIRFSRGVDGKVITADRPFFSFLPIGRPLAGLSVAALAAFFGIAQPGAALAAPRPFSERTDGAAASQNQATPRYERRISGTVFDQIGETLPGATVSAVNELTHEEFTAEAGGDGTYRLALPAGTYSVKISLAGFNTFTRDHVYSGLGGGTRLDATLFIGIMGEVVTVSRTDVVEPAVVKALTAPIRGLKRLFGNQDGATCKKGG